MYDAWYWEVLRAVMAIIYGLSWTDVLLGTGFICLIALLWRLHRGAGAFDIDDIFLDDVTGRASLSKLVIAVMAGLATWAVITLLNLHEVAAVISLLPIVLGIFVVGKSFDRWSGRQQMSDRADPTEPPQKEPEKK